MACAEQWRRDPEAPSGAATVPSRDLQGAAASPDWSHVQNSGSGIQRPPVVLLHYRVLPAGSRHCVLPDGNKRYGPTAATKSNTGSGTRSQRRRSDSVPMRNRSTATDGRATWLLPNGRQRPARRATAPSGAEIRCSATQGAAVASGDVRVRSQTNLSARGRLPSTTQHFVSRSNAKSRNVGGSSGPMWRVITLPVRAGEKQTVLYFYSLTCREQEKAKHMCH